MVECTLFGRQIAFDDASERFIDIQYDIFQTVQEAQRRFTAWYSGCKEIETVLHGYSQFVKTTVRELAFQPLYKSLVQCGIYDLAKDIYWQRCADFSESEDALRFIKQNYDTIIGLKEADIERRAVRKASRGRWQGGGFGLKGTVKGAVMAGSLNLLSGAAHSAFNAVGNAASSAAASSAKHKLYARSETQETLFNGLTEDILNFFGEHLDVITEHKPDYIACNFDVDRADALFENAKNIPNKREELLVQSFTLYPWNRELLKYIFVNYPGERRTISSVAYRFHVDLSDTFELLLAREYTEEDRQSEEAAQRAKARICAIMREYNIASSPTLDRLENDCLARICNGYESADKETCFSMKRTIQDYDAQDANKTPYLEKLQQRIISIWADEMGAICAGHDQADEAACNEMKNAIQSYDAPDEQKEPFLQKLQKRIEEIWSAEDGAEFDKLYMAADITDPAAVKEATDYIKQKARTTASEKYINALDASTPQNIVKARTYRRGSRPKLYTTLGLIFFLLALSNLFLLHLGLWVTISCIVVSLVFAGLHNGLYQPWKTLTLDGTVLHPAIIKDLPLCKKGIPAFIIAFVIVAVITVLLRWMGTGGMPVLNSDPSANIPAEVEIEAIPTATASAEPPAETQTPVEDPVETSAASAEDLDALYSLRASTFEQSESGERFNRYLDADGNVRWYYDDTIDETTTENMAEYVNSSSLYDVFDAAIVYGVNPDIYISAYEGEAGYTSSSDPTINGFMYYLGTDMRVYYAADNTVDPVESENLWSYIGYDYDSTSLHDGCVENGIDPTPYEYSLGYPEGDMYNLSTSDNTYGSETYNAAINQLTTQDARGYIELPNLPSW